MSSCAAGADGIIYCWGAGGSGQLGNNSTVQSLSPIQITAIEGNPLHGKKIYVSIKDNGFGISKKDQMLIWDRFYMADKAHTATKNKGTGLGLSIVKKIVDEHKEVIWVESNKGSGSTFIFTLTMFDPNKHKIENEKLLPAGSVGHGGHPV